MLNDDKIISKIQLQFLEKFKLKYPYLNIIKYTGNSQEMVVEDIEGIKYRQCPASKFLKVKLLTQCITNKNDYITLRLKEKHPNLELVEFKGMKENILVKDTNGFYYSPQCYDLLVGHPVSIQTCTDKVGLFIFKSNLKHNNKFSYKPFIYTNGKQKVEIECKIHGIFKQKVESHLSGRGCPKCGHVGFSRNCWLNKLADKKAIFYILKVFNDDEEFIKVGITTKTVKDRYYSMKNYKYEIIKTVISDGNEIYELEKMLLREFKKYKIKPKLAFEGWTECLDIKCLDDVCKFK